MAFWHSVYGLWTDSGYGERFRLSVNLMSVIQVVMKQTLRTKTTSALSAISINVRTRNAVGLVDSSVSYCCCKNLYICLDLHIMS